MRQALLAVSFGTSVEEARALHYLTAVGKAGGPEAQYDARRDPDQQAEGQALKDTVHR